MTENRDDIVENLDAQQEAYSDLSDEVLQKLEWFRDQKIGIIFHWGLYSEAGIVESWQLSEEDDWARKKDAWREDLDTLRRDYWSLNQKFDPKHFNPESWAKKSKEAGFRYMIFTTKHHDGFNMYDTKYSDYKITDSKSKFHENKKSDVLKWVVQAFQQQGLHTGLYYSKPDWYSADYWVPGQHPKGRYASYDPVKDPKTWESFSQFVENQLVELCENYGPVDILWLDGGWVNTENNEYLPMDDIAENLRKIQPDLLIVDRAVGGKHENYVTPERKIPDVAPKKAWESNIPLAKNWGYVPNDEYKSFAEILSSVIKVVSMGGNVILGVGPKPDGTLTEESLVLMEQLGEWLDLFGEGIYETRPFSEFTQEEWCFTQKGQNVYAFKRNNQEINTLNVKEFPIPIKKVIDMETGQQVAIKDGKICISQTACFVGITLQLEGEEKE